MKYYRIVEINETYRGPWHEQHDKKLLEKWIKQLNEQWPDKKHAIEELEVN